MSPLKEFATTPTINSAREVLVRPPIGGPAQGQLAERLELFERQGSVAVELQHGEESRDHDPRLGRTGDELPEVEGSGIPQQGDDDRRLLADADERRMQVVEADVADLLRRQRQQASAAKSSSVSVQTSSGTA